MEKLIFTFEINGIELVTTRPITQKQVNTLFRKMSRYANSDSEATIVSVIPIQVPDEQEGESDEL